MKAVLDFERMKYELQHQRLKDSPKSSLHFQDLLSEIIIDFVTKYITFEEEEE